MNAVKIETCPVVMEIDSVSMEIDSVSMEIDAVSIEIDTVRMEIEMVSKSTPFWLKINWTAKVIIESVIKLIENGESEIRYTVRNLSYEQL